MSNQQLSTAVHYSSLQFIGLQAGSIMHYCTIGIHMAYVANRLRN